MKIKNIKIQDLRNIEIFESEFGDWNMICGKNGAWKSTIVDAIFGAIKWKKYFESDPFRLVKHDSEKAVMTLTLEWKDKEIVINRVFSKPTESQPKGYDTLKIVDNSGEKLSQKDLDAFFSSFTIDPLFIAKQKPKEQIEIIKEVAGIDTADLEAEAVAVYEQRTIENRELSRLNLVVAGFWEIEEIEGVNVVDLMKTKDEFLSHNSEIDTAFSESCLRG